MCDEGHVCMNEPNTKSAFVPVSLNNYTTTVIISEKKKRISPEFQNFCRYLRERQNQMPLPDLTIATPFMRPQLVDWLFKTSEYLHLSKKIIFQTLTLVDLYTTRVVVNSDELGLIFVTSLFSCSKFESTGIKVSDVQKLCNNKYRERDIIGMEKSY
ncbi:cyclin, putative [Entamoeba histolytica KU27]|uniref:Cyclin, putative n=1 Tax=Entamoeba histolytica KU27 TaxID=885311 RepID=M2Q514_ENTHI|nr:cyclin, putative [Entamoeba histolytica KU27]